jgi:hypothetical protein
MHVRGTRRTSHTILLDVDLKQVPVIPDPLAGLLPNFPRKLHVIIGCNYDRRADDADVSPARPITQKELSTSVHNRAQ